MRIAVTLTILVALFVALPIMAQEAETPPATQTPEGLPEVVAQINGEDVTAQEFVEAVRLTEARQRMREEVPDDFQLSPQDRMRVLQLLLESKALRMLAHEAEIEVPEEDIDAQIQQEMERAGGEEAFQEVLQKAGMSMEEYRELVEEQLLQRVYAASKVEDVEVTDEEVRASFDRVKQAGQDKVPARAELRHILILVRGEDEAAWEKAKEEIEAARKRIVDGGEDFAAVAREVSEDPRTAQVGGLLRLAEGPKESDFERYAFELEEGKVSPPFRSDVGWHILKVENRTPGETLVYEDVKERLREQMLRFKRTQVFRERLLQAMQEMDIAVYIGDPAQQQQEPKDATLDEINELLQQSQ